jgi:hypothetical protein
MVGLLTYSWLLKVLKKILVIYNLLSENKADTGIEYRIKIMLTAVDTSILYYCFFLASLPSGSFSYNFYLFAIYSTYIKIPTLLPTYRSGSKSILQLEFFFVKSMFGLTL